ncbi:MAG: cyclic nucleotide-binding domain-containing protein [Planctomycetes bacterium]|nr:cyclic nucleotide-binding domain-containing protein [Planctomycetota bacterium]MCB9934641.1 cyclic nucleotide-binding domain-containing protein [Planctomycetota bacterium]
MSAREAVVREFAPGELVCRQGAQANRAFILRAGSLRSSVVPEKVLTEADDARLRRGHDVNLYTEAGAILELEGGLTGHYLTSLIAGETTIVAEFPVDTRAVMSMIQEAPAFGLSLARSLARRMVAANKSLGGAQRLASRFLRDFQGLCTDFYNLVQRIGDDAEGEDDVLQVLSAAKRSWSYGNGEVGGAELTKNTRVIMARVVDDRNMVGKQHRLKAGDLLCRRGDPGYSVYLLVSGRLSVRIGSEQYGVVRPGETVGEIGVLLGDEEPKRIADIQADEPSVVGVIPSDQFPKLVMEQPKLLINLCRLMCLRVKSFEQLAGESEDALRAVAARYVGEDATFLEDVEKLREQLEMLAGEHDLPLEGEVEALNAMGERWLARREELNEKLPAETS